MTEVENHIAAKNDDTSSVDLTSTKSRSSRSNSLAQAIFSPFTGNAEDDDKNRSVVEILESKIFQLELDRFNLGFGDVSKDVKVEEDSITYKDKVQTRFRRVSLTESNYNVGWVVDGDVNHCMCCRSFFFLMSKYHCRACGNIVCNDCSPYAANIPLLNEFKGSRICTKCFHEMLRDQFVDKRCPPPHNSIADHTPSDIFELDDVSPSARRKLLVTIVEDNDTNNPHSAVYDQDPLNPSGESKTRSSTDTSTMPQPSPSQTKLAEFYLDPQSTGKAATYLRSASERNISTDENDDNRITVVASKAMKGFLEETQRLSIESSQVSAEYRGSLSTGSIPGPPSCPPPGDDDDWDDEEPAIESLDETELPLEPQPSPQVTHSSTSSLLPKERLIKFLLQGEAYKAQSVINYGVQIPSKEELVDTLHYCLDHIDDLQSPMDTFVVLIERCGVDVNAVDESGVSPLMKLVRLDEQKIGSYFIFFQGADALQVHSKGECPLSISLSSGRSWVLSEFQLNQEDALLASDDFSRKQRYVACLVIAGYASLVIKLLESRKVDIDEDEAMYLFEECRRNIKGLKEPRRTFELLHRLGAPRYDVLS